MAGSNRSSRRFGRCSQSSTLRCRSDSQSYGRNDDGRPPLKVGSFVQAKIEGKTLDDVFVIPRVLLRENAFVLLIDSENYLTRREVGLAWETDDVIVVNKGLDVGDRLCLTEVPYALEGWPVSAKDETGVELVAEVPAEDAPARARPPRPPAGGGSGGFGDRIDSMIEAAGDNLPDDLRSKLLVIKESGDFAQMAQYWENFANGQKLMGSNCLPAVVEVRVAAVAEVEYAVSNALQSIDFSNTQAQPITFLGVLNQFNQYRLQYTTLQFTANKLSPSCIS